MFRDALRAAGGEAGEFVVRVREAEVVEDEGCVLVEVVVFELEVVRFAVVAGFGGGGGAEAEGAGEVVAVGVGGGGAGGGGDGAAGEAGDFAVFDFGGGEGVGEGGEGDEEEECGGGEDGGHFFGLGGGISGGVFCGVRFERKGADGRKGLAFKKISLVRIFPSPLGFFEIFAMFVVESSGSDELGGPDTKGEGV